MTFMETLDVRTYNAARRVRDWVNNLSYSVSNKEYMKQLIRSSGSVAANYLEAKEALSKADFTYRLKVSRKEARESILWLSLLESSMPEQKKEAVSLIDEYTQLVKILSASIKKLTSN